eukprot:TRINITY_DN2946_c0_g1_i1.p1 TRINITY_DN2946_c0_g1~~TRINITY_DN2946_c0_g1_i1.p1  ORF type:complete len:192 (+),score=16.86 TRINITY_DN2946_c0_g1_i1:422-997(+)
MNERFFDWNISPSFVIDSTHCPIERSILERDFGENREIYHSFKDKKHACYSIKYQFLVSMSRPRIIHVSSGFPGSIHDLTIARISGIVDFALNNGERGKGDKAYAGCAAFVTPFKKTRNRPRLSDDQKQFNKSLEKYRNNVERVNSRIKIFKCTVHQWRHEINDQPRVLNLLASIINISFIFRPLNQDDKY